MPDPVDATLATAGRPCDLGTDPSQFLTRIEDWWETHSLLVDSITDLPDVRKLKLLLLWGGKEFRKFAKDAGVQKVDQRTTSEARWPSSKQSAPSM